MNDYYATPDPALGDRTPWPLIASSLWLRLAFVATTGVVVALTEFYKGDLSSLAAMAWILGGAWLATHSWRRALHLLDRLDDAGGLPAPATPEAIAQKAATQPSWNRRDAGATPIAPQLRG